MQVRLLGPLEASSDTGDLALGGPKQRLLLTVLALRLGRVTSTDELIEAGWGEDLPSDPANALQFQVAKLRKVIEPAPADPRHLITAHAGYRLDAETVTTDLEEFNAAVVDTRQAFEAGDLAHAASSINTALGLWRGPALADFRYEEFARVDVERLDDEWLAATELKLDVALADGRHVEVAPELAQLTGEHPLREGLWARRALALYRGGRQSEAVRVFQDARRALTEVGFELGADLRDLETRMLDQDRGLLLAAEGRPGRAARPRSNLPAPPNRLVGRDTDVERATQLLDEGRVLTLVGPGGVGKTRLGTAVARAVTDHYAAGTWFVPLDTLEDGSLLPAAIGRVIGMRENPDRPLLDTLADHIGAAKTLILLDNCEHLVDAIASTVDHLTRACGELDVLATSQVTLAVPGEVVLDVAPLTIPGGTASVYDPIGSVDAVALFVERARDVGAPVDEWDDAALAAVANIVTALEGLPLALELAAARTRSMSLEEIALGLDDRFAVLARGPRTAPTRQRSLLGAVEWSLLLLDEPKRRLMADLSVFVGSFDATDVAAVMGRSVAEVRDDLGELVDRSLLTRHDDVLGAARFALSETLRHHGLRGLDTDSLASLRDAHLDHFIDLSLRADKGLRGPDQMAWLYRLDSSYDNIRGALGWSLEGGSRERGIELAASLGRYWDWRGLLNEGFSWTARMTARDSEPVPGLPAVRSWGGFMAWELHHLEEAQAASDLAIADAEAMDDWYGIAAGLSIRVLISRSEGDIGQALAFGEAFADAAAKEDDSWLDAWVESVLATVAHAAGDLDDAGRRARRSQELFAAAGDRQGESWGLLSLAQVSLDTSDLEAAEQHARAALDAAVALEDDRSRLWALEILADAARRRGEAKRSARLWGASHPLRQARGLAESVAKLAQQTELGELLRDELGDRFEKLFELGCVRRDDVIATELAHLNSPPPS